MFLRFGGIRSHDLAIGAGDVLFWDRFGERCLHNGHEYF